MCVHMHECVREGEGPLPCCHGMLPFRALLSMVTGSLICMYAIK